MTLHLDFVYSYEYRGERCKERSTHPSTTPWSEVLKFEQGVVAWRSNFRAIRREWAAYCWPGGYPLYYVVKDCGVLCSRCANSNLARTLDRDDSQFFIVAVDANYEDPELYCDHCNERIPSAYVEDERKEHIKLLEEVYSASKPSIRYDNAVKALQSFREANPIFGDME